MIPWHRIVIHHSATKDSGTVSWDAIRRYHTEVLGWHDIGYNMGIELVDNHYEILVGRGLLEIGAHMKGYNQNSFGICLIGNYDIVEPPEEALDILAKLTADLLHLFHLSVNQVKGHRDFNPWKTCPGKQFDLNKLKEKIIQAKGDLL